MTVLMNDRHPDYANTVSGIDRLFLAPELCKYNKKGPINDVWSIGAILYLLITGGHKEKAEKFDFTEAQWFYVSDELKDFMHLCVEVDHNKRSSIDTLLNSEFISMYHNKEDDDPLSTRVCLNTTLVEERNLYKFQVAAMINEIMSRA